MADKRVTPEAQDKRDDTQQDAHKGPRRKKRVPPTIDLTAQEVKPATPDPPPEAGGEQRKADPMPEFDAAAKSPGEGRAKARGWRIAGRSGPIVAGGVAGAAIVGLMMAVLWLTGLVPARNAGSSGRVATLEAQMRELQSRPAAVTDTKAIDALRQRLNKIENDVASLPPGDKSVAERLAAADNAMKALGVALAALNKRSDDVATNAAKARDNADAAAKAVADLRTSVETMKSASAAVAPAAFDALQKRIAALEQSAKATRDDIAKAATSDKAARLALSAVTLRDAVASGAPFTAELTEAKSLGADGKSLDALESFAGRGLPTDKALANELRDLIPAMVKAAGAQAPTGGFLERLQANAGKLVRIRPVDAPPGDDAGAVLARIEVAAAKGDIPAALADLAKLPEAARAPAKNWIDRAKTRQAAVDAARRLAAQTAGALGPRTGTQ
jgi:hypothetical protein